MKRGEKRRKMRAWTGGKHFRLLGVGCDTYFVFTLWSRILLEKLSGL
jgi:hypothetical protein